MCTNLIYFTKFKSSFTWFSFAVITTIELSTSVVFTDPAPSVAAREDTGSSGISSSIGLSVAMVVMAVIVGFSYVAYRKHRRAKRRERRRKRELAKQLAIAEAAAASPATAAAAAPDAGDDDDLYLYSDYDTMASEDDAEPPRALQQIKSISTKFQRLRHQCYCDFNSIDQALIRN